MKKGFWGEVGAMGVGVGLAVALIVFFEWRLAGPFYALGGGGVVQPATMALEMILVPVVVGILVVWESVRLGRYLLRQRGVEAMRPSELGMYSLILVLVVGVSAGLLHVTRTGEPPAGQGAGGRVGDGEPDRGAVHELPQRDPAQEGSEHPVGRKAQPGEPGDR